MKSSWKNAAKLKAIRPGETVPAWAFRFLQSIKGVTMILSGMSNFTQLQENIHTFETDQPLNEEEMAGLLSVAAHMLEKKTVPCTACHYCVSHCPQELDIPALLELYNEHSFTGGGFLAPMRLGSMPKEKWPDACVGCGSCEAVCPQQIHIPEVMKAFSEML